MEAVRVFQNEDCDFLNKMLLFDEEADSALQFLPGFGTPSDYWSCTEANANFAFFDESFNSNFCFSKGNTNISTYSNNYSACVPNLSQETPQFCHSNIIMNDIPESMPFCEMDRPNNTLAQFYPSDRVMHDAANVKIEMRNAELIDLGIKRKFEVPQQPEDVVNVENPKKKCRVPRDIPTCKKMVQAKRNKGLTQIVNIDEDSAYNGPVAQSSSSYSSGDDSNTSQELNGGSTSDSKGSVALNLSKKPRAGRGAATDPQSLYARKRREKINERLRILQNLVPNGTKVDISTMLEDAVHYVQFLQLQIKLLSSDEMWMYAPIAHKGMDMGLYQNISPPL